MEFAVEFQIMKLLMRQTWFKRTCRHTCAHRTYTLFCERPESNAHFLQIRWDQRLARKRLEASETVWKLLEQNHSQGVWGRLEAWAASRWDGIAGVKVPAAQTEAGKRDLNRTDSIEGFFGKTEATRGYEYWTSWWESRVEGRGARVSAGDVTVFFWALWRCISVLVSRCLSGCGRWSTSFVQLSCRLLCWVDSVWSPPPLPLSCVCVCVHVWLPSLLLQMRFCSIPTSDFYLECRPNIQHSIMLENPTCFQSVNKRADGSNFHQREQKLKQTRPSVTQYWVLFIF